MFARLEEKSSSSNSNTLLTCVSVSRSTVLVLSLPVCVSEKVVLLSAPFPPLILSAAHSRLASCLLYTSDAADEHRDV